MPQRQLILYADSDKAQTVLLSAATYRLGRDAECDITLASRNVSGNHCSLLSEKAGVKLVDLGSTNGSFVNGKRVKKKLLKNGDAITLGDVTLRYIEEANAQLRDQQTTDFYHLPGEAPESRLAAFLASLSENIRPDENAVQTAINDYKLLKRNNALLETLYSLLDKVLSISDRDTAVALLLKELRSLLGLEIASIYLVEERRFGILEDEDVEWSSEYPVVSRSVLSKVIKSAQPMVIDEVDHRDSGMKTLVKFKIRQALCFPVLDREKNVSGVVYCVSREIGHLELLKNDTHFLEACSAFIALVLENLHMLEREKKEAYAKAKQYQVQRYSPIIKRLRQQRENLSLKLGTTGTDEQLFGFDQNRSGMKEFIVKAAPTGLPILITGETGVGKTVFAGAIHRAHSPDRPFITIDCTTIPHNLLESELFGHEKGAFTGAHARKPGKVAVADNGTLFIDEIGELDGALQAKLLRFIQTGDFEPLGSTETRHSSARVIAATNRDLREEVAQKRFREDLYYRLNVLSFELPPLRKRKEMIAGLANHFLLRYAGKLNPEITCFSNDALKLIKNHLWPGNIREMENSIMRALVNASGHCVEVQHLALEEMPYQTDDFESIVALEGGEDAMDLKAAREHIDRLLITRALDMTGRNVSRAATILKISRNSLMDLVKKYQL